MGSATPESAVLASFLLAWGSLWGSFLNVVVWRLPRGHSVVRPRSRCPGCGTPIAAWHNVPVLSWLWLRGRCASCAMAISPRYPAVEAVVAALALAVAVPWLPACWDGEAIVPRAVAAVLIEQLIVFAWVAIALIDAETFTIPDPLSLPLPLAGFVLAWVAGDLRGVDWRSAGAGALAGGAGLALVQLAYARLTGREGLGTGDVKLLAGIGAVAGVAALPAILLAAAVSGLAFAGAYAAVGTRVTEARGVSTLRHLALPFGPFLAVAAIAWLLLHRLAAPLAATLWPWLA